MKKLILSVLAFTFTLLLTSAAGAATVTFRLYVGNFAQGPGTFKVTAEASLGDNFGIASYGVQLVGNPSVGPGGSILTVDHSSLRAPSVTNSANDEGPAGFTLLRSADDTTPAAGTAVYNFTGSQDTINETPHLIRGFGQQPGDTAIALGVAIFPPPEGNTWGNAGVTYPGRPAPPAVGEFEIGRGTVALVPGGGLPGTPRSIDFRPVPTAITTVNVFTATSGIGTEAAAYTRILVIPEPASLGLAGVALLSLAPFVGRRRPRNQPPHQILMRPPRP